MVVVVVDVVFVVVFMLLLMVLFMLLCSCCVHVVCVWMCALILFIPLPCTSPSFLLPQVLLREAQTDWRIIHGPLIKPLMRYDELRRQVR